MFVIYVTEMVSLQWKNTLFFNFSEKKNNSFHGYTGAHVSD